MRKVHELHMHGQLLVH